MNLQAGDLFSHYQVRAHIAHGGTGDVYRALDTVTARDVALKIPTRSAILDPRKYEYFLRELDALQVLEHPGVQHQIESGRSDNTPYLVTELIGGQSLRGLIKASGPLPVDRAVALTCKIADSLQYCHEQHVVHRDIKPENILVSEDDRPVIIDFGLAKSQARPGSVNAGTPDYMAPEQIEGHSCDARTDIYALGAVVYEMLTGKPPFSGDDPYQVMQMHLYKGIPRLDRALPVASPQLATVVAKCLQRDPLLRYPDMRALICDLVALDQVDPSQLDVLCAEPPKAPFYKNQIVQAVIMSFVLMFGIVLLGLFLATLKQAH